jgi:DNA gyrase subunit A
VRLYQLTGLERGKIEAEYLGLMKIIEELRGILESEAKLLALIKSELLEMKEKYASPRKTEIIAAAGEFRMEDVIPNEGCVITVSHLGFIKRTRVSDYRSQKRGAKGVKLLTLADGDRLLNIARIVETVEETGNPFEG